MKRRLRRLVVAILVSGLLTACSAGAGSAPQPTSTSTAGEDSSLVIGFSAEPANLDFTRTDGAAIPEALLVNVYEGLVKLDQSTGEVG